jgi:uncharacterized protein
VNIDPEARGPVLTMPGAPRAFHLMAKPSGATCNLDCDYCFFLSKEMLYPGSRFRMAEELQETYIRQLLEAHRSVPEVIVAWQGGEPTLMGLDFFRRSIELIEQYKRPGQHILNTIQTNGTLLTAAWGEFLAANKFLVGISIDGPRDIHDTYRVDKGGKPTFDKVMRGLGVLREHKVDYNILTTVHAANQHRGREVYRFLRDDCGAEFMQFIPIVERATPETLAAANIGWGERGKLRPLYVLDGNLVTDRTVSPDGSISTCGRTGSAGTSGPSTSRCSTLPWPTGWVSPAGCASTPRPVGSSWRWSTTATCTRATTSWSHGSS